MKRLAIMVVLSLLIFAMPALAEQKLYNITEDTIPDDSYRPVAGKEFLIAVKLVDVDANNQEQSVSNETIQFQTSVGTLSEAEVTTNIYGEALTWLTTSATADIVHNITASVKDRPEITPVTVKVKNIALPQDAPTAEQLIQKVEENNDKIQDIKGDVTVTSNAPWSVPTRILKIWKKGEKQKVQEISPKPGIYLRPELLPQANPPQILKEIVAFNPTSQKYSVSSKPETQDAKFPYNVDYIDSNTYVIVSSIMYLLEDNVCSKFVTEDLNFSKINGIWIFMEEKKLSYQGLGKQLSLEDYVYSNIEINTGLSDSIFQ